MRTDVQAAAFFYALRACVITINVRHQIRGELKKRKEKEARGELRFLRFFPRYKWSAIDGTLKLINGVQLMKFIKLLLDVKN